MTGVALAHGAIKVAGAVRAIKAAWTAPRGGSRSYAMTPPWIDSLDATNCDHSSTSCLNSGVARV